MPADLYKYSGRQLAWHHGLVVPNAETMEDLRIAAGLDYDYVLVPVFWEKEQNGEVYHIQEKGKRLVTINGETSLGYVVSNDYQYHQPAELCAAMDNILSASKDINANWRPETALALGRGETTCYCISLGSNNVGNSDCHDYLIITDTIDGKHSLTAAVVKIRVVCRNTLRAALSGAKVSLNIRHNENHRSVFNQSVEAIIASQGKVQEALTLLAEQAITEQYVNEYLDKLFEVPEVGDERRSPTVVKKMGALKLSAQNNYYRMVEKEGEQHSKWTLFNAAQETIEHSGLISSEKVAIKSILTGTGVVANKITEAYALLV